MAVRAAVAPAPPRRGLLLRDPDHHHPEAALALGPLEMLTGEVLLDLALHEPDHRDVVVEGELVDRVGVVAAHLAQHGRRGDRKPAIQQEPDHLPLGLQSRDVPLQEQPIHRPDLEGHVIGE